MTHFIEISVSPMEVGEAIAQGALRKYADPQGLKVTEDGIKADRYGILIQFSPRHRLLRFRFVPRGFPDKLVDITYRIEDFIAEPERFLANTHRAMQARLKAMRQEQSPILLFPPTELSRAIEKSRNEVMH